MDILERREATLKGLKGMKDVFLLRKKRRVILS